MAAITDEYVRMQYGKEEDFLEEHYETVDVLLARIGDVWRPNFRCTNAERQRREILLARGRLRELVFDAAVIFYGREGLTSIRVYLRSSWRFLVARIHWPGAEAAVEILCDCVPLHKVRRC